MRHSVLIEQASDVLHDTVRHSDSVLVQRAAQRVGRGQLGRDTQLQPVGIAFFEGLQPVPQQRLHRLGPCDGISEEIFPVHGPSRFA
jgi:hypothetical protein